MIYSMTGYGKGTAEKEDLSCEVEIKSLNSRFLELSVKYPPSLSSKEFEIREILRKKIKRGKVAVFINLRRAGKDVSSVPGINKDAFDSSLSLLKQVKSRAKIKGKISLQDMLSLGKYYMSEEENDETLEASLCFEALESAIAELGEMKAKEGGELSKDLDSRLSAISEAVEKISSSTDDSVKSYFERLKERAKSLCEGITDFNDRLEAELALLSERFDITEECVRLRSHIKMSLDTISSSPEAGRRLNFLCQEMNREANTINSKTQSTEISYLGIFIKEELEKIREQIQNIE